MDPETDILFSFRRETEACRFLQPLNTLRDSASIILLLMWFISNCHLSLNLSQLYGKYLHLPSLILTSPSILQWCFKCEFKLMCFIKSSFNRFHWKRSQRDHIQPKIHFALLSSKTWVSSTSLVLHLIIHNTHIKP